MSSTNFNQPEKAQAIHSTTEALDLQRTGTDRLQFGGGPKASNSSSHALPLAQTSGARCRDLFEWSRTLDRSWIK